MVANILAKLLGNLDINHIDSRNCLSIETVSNNFNILVVSFMKLQLELAHHGAYHGV